MRNPFTHEALPPFIKSQLLSLFYRNYTSVEKAFQRGQSTKMPPIKLITLTAASYIIVHIISNYICIIQYKIISSNVNYT
jgi:hypothetical protein